MWGGGALFDISFHGTKQAKQGFAKCIEGEVAWIVLGVPQNVWLSLVLVVLIFPARTCRSPC